MPSASAMPELSTVRVSPTRAVPPMTGAPVAGLLAARSAQRTITRITLVRRCPSDVHTTPGFPHLPPGAIAIPTSRWPLGRMVTSHRSPDQLGWSRGNWGASRYGVVCSTWSSGMGASR